MKYDNNDHLLVIIVSQHTVIKIYMFTKSVFQICPQLLITEELQSKNHIHLHEIKDSFPCIK